MLDYKEVLRSLYDTETKLKYQKTGPHTRYEREIVSAAIMAAERMIPKAPEWKAMAGFEASVASHLACPTCGEGVTNYWAPGTKPKHCQFCGQALKWEEDVTNATV